MQVCKSFVKPGWKCSQAPLSEVLSAGRWAGSKTQDTRVVTEPFTPCKPNAAALPFFWAYCEELRHSATRGPFPSLVGADLGVFTTEEIFLNGGARRQLVFIFFAAPRAHCSTKDDLPSGSLEAPSPCSSLRRWHS